MEHSRAGHRSRMRLNFLNNDIDNLTDADVLELFLSVIIPQKDVKPITYNLLNHFGTIADIFSASVKELLEVEGVGENTAVAIKMYSDLENRERCNKIDLFDYDIRIDYVKNLGRSDENMIMLCVKGNGEFVDHAVIDSDYYSLLEPISKSMCSHIIIVHYGDGRLNDEDLNILINIRDAVSKIGVKIIDYIDVGEDCICALSKSSKHNYLSI